MLIKTKPRYLFYITWVCHFLSPSVKIALDHITTTIFGFGISLHYRLLRSSSFSLVPLLSIPFDVHIRNDDEYQDAMTDRARAGFLVFVKLCL